MLIAFVQYRLPYACSNLVCVKVCNCQYESDLLVQMVALHAPSALGSMWSGRAGRGSV